MKASTQMNMMIGRIPLGMKEKRKSNLVGTGGVLTILALTVLYHG